MLSWYVRNNMYMKKQPISRVYVFFLNCVGVWGSHMIDKYLVSAVNYRLIFILRGWLWARAGEGCIVHVSDYWNGSKSKTSWKSEILSLRSTCYQWIVLVMFVVYSLINCIFIHKTGTRIETGRGKKID